VTINAGDSQMFDWKILLIIFAIVIVIFGTKRLRSIGSDLGAGIKGFKEGIGSEEEKAKPLKAISERETVDVHVNSETDANVQPNRK
jgi:sec-independent protein translocase protein TatA